MSATDRFVSGAIAAGFAETATLPIDMSKVRLQTQVPCFDGTLKYRGMFQGIYVVAREEGPRALWKGIVPALVRQCSYTGLSFSLYPTIRNAIAGEGVAKEDISFSKRVLSGGLAGGISIVCMNPTDVVKTQMQCATKETSIFGLSRNILAREGVLGFWRGVEPNVARCFIGNACEIGCYDQFKTWIVAGNLLPDGPLSHFAASGSAGVVSAVCSTPVDVLKTRLMNQAGHSGSDQFGRYSGMLDAFVKILYAEGPLALYKGFLPFATRKVSWTIIYFLVYEKVLHVASGSYT
ncbi:hypothetical protein CYMTET_46278 [Cymbomonas tetramitiformis]|uniref:Mitochondrial carrier protein n=1 Tax=Cymbomonas tetramitiformis TaxID=36881 RepID=A0AAE0BWK1_9CHLO|nr:hypothetical protein CYMTET_46278 [Cymbomonas tetramitiformis]|eukprot:gene17472-20805_t